MGKKGSWISVVKKVFRRKSKNKEIGPANATEEVQANDASQKQRWSFSKPGRAATDASRGVPEKKASSPATESQQKNHALAIAAATAAAAEAAVAAAQAAAEVVRLTEGITGARGSSYNGVTTMQAHEEWAAVRIQTAFRGYLARRKLRALRGLARLQALVRGHAVKRQTTLTLRSMQALVRVQARVQARRIRMSEEGLALQRQIWQRKQQEMLTKQAIDLQTWNDSMHSMEKVEANKMMKQEAALKRERALAYAFSHQLWRSPPGCEYPPMYIGINEPGQKHQWGWSWLERWMSTRPWEPKIHERHSTVSRKDHQLVATKDVVVDAAGFDRKTNGNMNDAPLTLEASVPEKNTAINSTRHTPRHDEDAGEDPTNGVTETPVKGKSGEISHTTPSSMALRKPNAVKVRPASTRAMEEGSVVSTARSSQSLYSGGGGSRFYQFNNNRRSSVGGGWSVKEDEEGVGRSPSVPSYMAATESARAKARSASNPRQKLYGSSSIDKELPTARRRLSFPMASVSDLEEGSMDASSCIFTPRKHLR